MLMVFIYHAVAVTLLVLFAIFVGWYACDYLKYKEGSWIGLLIVVLLLLFMISCVSLGI